MDVPVLGLRGVDDALTAAILAPCLEVSAHPKPGNVSPTSSFPDATHAQFLASAAALHGPLSRLAGRAAGNPAHAGLGTAIEEAVEGAHRWHTGGNTLLGTHLLLVPLFGGAVRSLSGGSGTLHDLVGAARELVRDATPNDTAAIYRAISAANPGGLGSAERWDAAAPDAADRVMVDGVTPLVAFSESAERDDIAREWVDGFTRSQRACRLLLDSECETSHAVVITYMRLLAERPDTLIRRKAGEGEARKVSLAAKRLMDEREPLSTPWWRGVRELDRELRREGNKRNPGTTADLTAAGLFLALCCGMRVHQ